MKDRKHFLLHNNAVRERARDAVTTAPDGYHCIVQEPTRTLDQNAAQWPILHEFSEQLEWPVNGKMVKMSEEEWKDVLTAAFREETVRLAMGLNGGVVMLGARTREFGQKEFSDWLAFLNATADDRGVKIERKAKQQ